MFNNLTNFGYQRSAKEAVGFYIAYLVLFLFAGVILTVVGALITSPNNPFEFGVLIGSIVASISSLGVSFLILKEKKLLGNFGCILLFLLSGLLAFFVGGIVGLIPAAYLTTKPTNRN